MQKNKLSNSTAISIVKEYYLEDKISIANKYGINPRSIPKIIKDFGLPLKGSGSKINVELDNMDKKSDLFNYFLGWAATDGSIGGNKTECRFTLSITDECVVDYFLGKFNGAKKYFVYKNRKKLCS